MLAEEIAIGMRVRYPRTGTTGRVLRIEKHRGEAFAELDATNLLYRIDHLIPVTEASKKNVSITEDAREVIARERELGAHGNLQEVIKNIDQSCEGGG